VDDLGVDRDRGRPIKLFELSDWAWVHPRSTPFVLFVAANATADDELAVRRFAADAIDDGCACVCAWGERCSWVHDRFDLASIDVGRSVMSSWHADESLAEALYFALFDAWPDEEAFPNAYESPIVLAVEEAWLAEVRRLVADQDELKRLVLGEGD
jgi:hypothetical protein